MGIIRETIKLYERKTSSLKYAIMQMIQTNDIKKFEDEGKSLIKAYYDRYSEWPTALNALEFLHDKSADLMGRKITVNGMPIDSPEFIIMMSEFYIEEKFQFTSGLIERILENQIENSDGDDRVRQHLLNVLKDFPKLDFFKHGLLENIITHFEEDPEVIKEVLRCPNFNWKNVGDFVSRSKSLLYILCTDPAYDMVLIKKLIHYGGDINYPNTVWNMNDEFLLNPLAGALISNNLEVAELLLAEPYIKTDHILYTPNNRSGSILKVIVKLGANIKSIRLLEQYMIKKIDSIISILIKDSVTPRIIPSLVGDIIRKDIFS